MTVLCSSLGNIGCRPKAVPISKADTVHPALQKRSLAALTRLFNRKVRRGKIHLSMTLWDRSFVEAFLRKRAQKKGWPETHLKAAIERWTQRFLKNKTSFRVRLEALDRPLTVEGQDSVLDLEAWRWELWDSNGKKIEPKAVDMESKRVFKGKKGRYSFRIDGNLHFDYVIDPQKVSWIELLAIPPGDIGTLRVPRWRVKS